MSESSKLCNEHFKPMHRHIYVYEYDDEEEDDDEEEENKKKRRRRISRKAAQVVAVAPSPTPRFKCHITSPHQEPPNILVISKTFGKTRTKASTRCLNLKSDVFEPDRDKYILLQPADRGGAARIAPPTLLLIG